jgi:hypothetical protein
MAVVEKNGRGGRSKLFRLVDVRKQTADLRYSS